MSDKGLFREQALFSQRSDGTGNAVYDQPVSLRLLLLMIVSAFVAVLVYAATAHVNQTVIVRGFVSSAEGEIKVYSPRAGQLEELHVHNGDLVHRSQILATVAEQGVDRQGQDVRLRSALYVDEQIRQIRKRLTLGQQRLELQALLANNKRTSLDRELDIRQEEHRLVLWQLDNVQSEFQRIEQLNLGHLVSDSELASAESTLLSMQKNLQMSQLNLDATLARKDELETQQQLENIRLADESLALAFTLSQLMQRREEMQLEHSFAVPAPVSGRVENLLNRSGDFLNPRQPLLSIVPVEPTYKALMFLPSRALGKVEAGQQVTLIYDAYPLYEHGSFQGRVQNISATPIDPREYLIPLDISEPVYLMEAELLQGHEELALRPGMQFSAELIVGSQTILYSILKPLRVLESRFR